MAADAQWVPPPTREVAVAGGRAVRYCCYGPVSGLPVISLSGTPGTRWERPGVVSAIEAADLRLVVPDRPGYGGSARQPGRTVADVAADVRAVADAQGWARFAVTGFSGGGPHALACAALLAGRVTCCAVVACPAPAGTPGADLLIDRAPGQAEDFRLALRGEQALRPYLRARAADALAQIEAASPTRPASPGHSPAATPHQPASPGHAATITPRQPTDPGPDPAATPHQPASPGHAATIPMGQAVGPGGAATATAGQPGGAATATAGQPADPGPDPAAAPHQPASPGHAATITPRQPARPGPDVAVVPGRLVGDGGRAVRLRAMYLGLDGWIDDVIALVRPWGFDLARINAPTAIWYGAMDTRVPREHTDWLLDNLPGARGYQYPGGHDPSDASYRTILDWIADAGTAPERA